MLTITGSFAECVVLETLTLSIFNHDSAIASAAARMVSAADGRPLIEMGSRRTHERAAVAAARAAYIAGFAGTSNLEAQRAYGVPALGTSARVHHAAHRYGPGGHRQLGRAAFRAQVDALGVGTTLLVDTYDVTAGWPMRSPSPAAGWARCASTPAISACWPARCAGTLDDLGATGTRIVVSGDLDEHSIAALRADPVDSYGVGTSVVTGSGAPTAGMVFKLVEVDGVPVEKRSTHKQSHGGRKAARRLSRPTGTIVEELIYPAGQPPADDGHRASWPCRWSVAVRCWSNRTWPPPADGWPTVCTACPGRGWRSRRAIRRSRPGSCRRASDAGDEGAVRHRPARDRGGRAGRQ